MARFVVDFSSVTDGTAAGGTGDNVLIAGGLTFTINAPGNWFANFLNGRLNFQEDPTVGGELFSIEIASETGEQLRFDDYQVSVTSNPLWHGGWSGYLRVTNGNSGTSWVPDDATGRGPQYYSEAFPGGPYPSGFLPAVQLYDLNTPGMTTSTTISFWLDNITVVTIVPPTIDTNGPASGTSNTTTFLEDGGAVRVTSSDSVLTDDGNLTRITFQLAAAPNGADEAISYDPTLNGGATLASLNLTGSYSSSTRTFTVTGEASSDIYQSVMRAVVYNNSNGAPNVADRTVTIRATDVDGVTGTGTAVIKVSAVNDAPQVSAPSTVAVTEDVASALTGISFSDVDAGSSPVTVELAAASGSLAATAGSGVFVSGSGSSLLSLQGTIAEINAFIAASNVTFTTALDATADVQLTVTVNDEGNSGTGSPLSISVTTTIDVTAVNDAPVNTVPAPQATVADQPLIFSVGNGNLISVLDVDSGGGHLRVTLTATNGLISLANTTGLTFVSGSGVANGSMTFSGTVADINASLNGLSFVPKPGFQGAAGIQIVTDDQGNAGSGGALSDTDFVPINIEPDAPAITNVSSDAGNGSYKVGNTLTLLITFNQAVTVDPISGTPTLLLETGSTDRLATYQSGSGSTTLAFSYTVQAGDVSADLDYASVNALTLNGGKIEAAGGKDAVLTLPAPATAGSLGANKAIVIDGVAPEVIATSAAFSADSGVSATDLITNVISQTLHGTLSAPLAAGEVVEVSLNNGMTWTTAAASSTDWSLTGISLEGSGTLQVRVSDQAGNHGEVSSHTYKLDTSGPTTATLSVDDSRLTAGETATLTVVFSEPVVAFTVQDLIVSNATVSGLSSADQTTWTATLTPAANTSADGNTISLDLAAIADVAGNIGSGVFNSNAYDVHTDKPPGPGPGPGPDPQPPEQPNNSAGDLLQGTPGDDILDGLGGVDVFRIQANREDVVITRNADGTITASHPAFGTDTLSNIELLRFDDQVEIINIPMGQISEPGSASFTEAGYLAQNPDVAAAIADGLFSSGSEHYQLYGAAEGRTLPTLAIDERFYLSQNDDVAAAVERGEFSSAQEHYLLFGINEGRSPNVLFDEAWYLSQNPDVAGAIAGGAVDSAYEHFQMYGWKEGRYPSAWMDLSEYLARNQDVAEAGMNPLDHFLNYGIHEGRTIQADDSGLWLM